MELKFLGEPCLTTVSEPVSEVDEQLRAFISGMFRVMRGAGGVGLAAPQVGRTVRVFVVDVEHHVRAFINPQITAASEEQSSYEEGCLSIPHIYERVLRPRRVSVQYLDENGKRCAVDADGILARVIQHEYDHLDGILF